MRICQQFLLLHLFQDPLTAALCISPILQPAFEVAKMEKAVGTSYRILSLPIGAGEHEILRAFKSKALQNHPDKGGEASEFQRIQHAKHVLLCNRPTKPCRSNEERQDINKARAATRAAERKAFETALAAGSKPGTRKHRSKEKLQSERIARQAFLELKAEKAKHANKQYCKGSKPTSSQSNKQGGAPPSKMDKKWHVGGEQFMARLEDITRELDQWA